MQLGPWLYRQRKPGCFETSREVVPEVHACGASSGGDDRTWSAMSLTVLPRKRAPLVQRAESFSGRSLCETSETSHQGWDADPVCGRRTSCFSQKERSEERR